MTARNATNNSTSHRPILFVPRSVGLDVLTILLVALLTLCGCSKSGSPAPPNEPNDSEQAEPNESKVAPTAAAQGDASSETITTETSLFDGKTLGKWKITEFGGQGEVVVKDGAIHMDIGQDLTGITWTGPLIRMDYEITLDAMRTKGSDFFCGLTFPFGDKPCSLILGGWGGSLCGISNIDYYDAANNETTRMISFENNKWYHVRLRITPDKIEAWLDDEVLVNVNVKGRRIDIRAEVDLSQPLGIATWQTAGAVRNIIIKPVTGGPALSDEPSF
ncbi:MAG: DUF1080 domain-containing protein [Sedimentisphaerales bacterium]|nr:DUF1080 domain-containing protein [Sedimentisphaerales bacterium]